MKSEEKLEQMLSKDYMPIIYKNIKRYRKECGLSLIKVADILNLSYDYLIRMESKNDLVKTCSLKLLIKFSILYDKSLDDFLKEN